MRRRSSVSGSCWPFRSPSPRRQLILFSVGGALLFLLAAALQVHAQDANPPPPPPDASAPQAPPAPGQSDIRAVRVSDVKGQVQVFQNGQLAFPQAEPNMPAVEGMRFVTGENGRLEIQFEDGSVARLAPNSSLRLAELRRNADGTTVTRIDALTGLSYYELLATPNQVSVTFDGAEISPSDNTTFRIALDPVPNQLAVMQGVVNIDDGGGVSLDVHPGHTFQIDPAQQGSFSVADSIQPNTWDQWNAHRDQVLAELANSGSPGTVDSGDAAWNDLNAYGNWYNVPGYGASWAPSGVGSSWDPFGSGYWGYYPSFGYTWISGYPWGWYPYHCGMWNYVGSWGWLWMPSGCGWNGYGATGWYPVVTVIHPPHGYHPPFRPRHGPGLRHRPIPLIPVNRGHGSGPQPIRIGHQGPRPLPRPLPWDGRTIMPVAPGTHVVPGRLFGSHPSPAGHPPGFGPLPVHINRGPQTAGHPGNIQVPRPAPSHPMPHAGRRIVTPRPQVHPLPAPRTRASHPAPHFTAPRPAPRIATPHPEPRSAPPHPAPHFGGHPAPGHPLGGHPHS